VGGGWGLTPRELDAAVEMLQEARERLASQQESVGLHLLLLMLKDARWEARGPIRGGGRESHCRGAWNQ
jgi:hypothetical protein